MNKRYKKKKIALTNVNIKNRIVKCFQFLSHFQSSVLYMPLLTMAVWKTRPSQVKTSQSFNKQINHVNLHSYYYVTGDPKPNVVQMER